MSFETVSKTDHLDSHARVEEGAINAAERNRESKAFFQIPERQPLGAEQDFFRIKTSGDAHEVNLRFDAEQLDRLEEAVHRAQNREEK